MVDEPIFKEAKIKPTMPEDCGGSFVFPILPFFAVTTVLFLVGFVAVSVDNESLKTEINRIKIKNTELQEDSRNARLNRIRIEEESKLKSKRIAELQVKATENGFGRYKIDPATGEVVWEWTGKTDNGD